MFAKFIDEMTLDFPPYEKDGVVNYNSDTNAETLLKEGYKPYIQDPFPLDIYEPQPRYRDEGDKIVGYWIEGEEPDDI